LRSSSAARYSPNTVLPFNARQMIFGSNLGEQLNN
jgi:hypothetical protein